jgi:hypothetical protein
MVAFGGIEAYLSSFFYLVTVIVPIGMIAAKTERKNKYILRALLCIAVMLIVDELFTFISDYIFNNVPAAYSALIYISLLKFLSVFILSGIGVKICFKCDYWGALFCATAGYCLQHISARISSVFEEFILSDMHWALSMFISVIIAAIVYTVFYFLILRKEDKKTSLVVENKWQVIIAVCVVGVNIIYNSFGISYLTSIQITMEEAGLDISVTKLLLMFVYLMSMLTAVLALALDLGMSKNKRLSGEMEELNRMINEGKRQYEYEKNNIEMINVKCHDLKHQLAAMKGKIYEEQIDELTGLIDIYDSSIKTGNEALDVVLTQKNFYCSRHGIRLTCLLNGKNYDFIPRHELYALFTNIIDNAIEAVENLPEEKRKISITECNVKGFLTVREENCFAGDLEINDGLPVSKKNSTEHGFGVKSMKLIAEKYGGGVSVNTEGDIFVLDIYFCNPEM